MARRYYSVRKGRALTLVDLKTIFKAIFTQFCEKQYFVEALGFQCVDAGFVPGLAGEHPELFFLRHLRKNGLWPISENIQLYSEDDLFDVIELTYDLVSKPLDGHMHSYAECGMHWEVFDRSTGRAEYRSEINNTLTDYSTGFELTVDGEIVEKADVGLETLVSAELPTIFGAVAKEKLGEAIHLFRRRNSTLTDRHSAVRLLADIFERLGYVNWQVLRRSFGTWLKIAGADVKDTQALMRHSRASTTMDIYVQDVPESQRSAVDRLSKMVN